MKQVLLDPHTGRVSLVKAPAPSASPTKLLVRTDVSALSPGTERLLLEMSSQSLLQKARSRPDAARQVLDVMRREGLRSAMWKAQARLDHPYPLGYSLAGTVEEAGIEVSGPAVGARVACSGAQIATHSEFVSVPKTLAVEIPEGVAQDEAAFAGIGAIAMHSVRLADIGPGATAAVLGLGVLGNLTLQILAAAGVWTIGVEPDAYRRKMAASLLAGQVSEDGRSVTAACRSRGGADAVIIAGGEGGAVFETAIEAARDRARLVVVGALPIEVDRDRMYRKELSLVVARSSGPGRYDPDYEESGRDLPPEYVRWTAGRNMSAFLELVLKGKVRVRELITQRFPIDDAVRAYELLERAQEPFLGVVLDYPSVSRQARRDISLEVAARPISGRPKVAVIGAGNFARGVLLPRLKRLPVTLSAVATATGASAVGTAKRFGFARAGTDAGSVIEAEDVDAVLVATRHDLHAMLAAEVLRAGRSLYVEKPLAIDREGLAEVCRAWVDKRPVLSVGFNRRFAPLIRRISQTLTHEGPVVASYMVNSGSIPTDSWILHPKEGGGVVLAEAGHFVDTLLFLIGARPTEVSGGSIDETSYQAAVRFEDGSRATIAYTTHSSERGPKEKLTLAGRGIFAELHDFRLLRFWQNGRSRTVRARRQDKGHSGALRAWVSALSSGTAPPMSILDIVAVTEATICLEEAVRNNSSVKLNLTPYLEILAQEEDGI